MIQIAIHLQLSSSEFVESPVALEGYCSASITEMQWDGSPNVFILEFWECREPLEVNSPFVLLPTMNGLNFVLISAGEVVLP